MSFILFDNHASFIIIITSSTLFMIEQHWYRHPLGELWTARNSPKRRECLLDPSIRTFSHLLKQIIFWERNPAIKRTSLEIPKVRKHVHGHAPLVLANITFPMVYKTHTGLGKRHQMVELSLRREIIAKHPSLPRTNKHWWTTPRFLVVASSVLIPTESNMTVQASTDGWHNSETMSYFSLRAILIGARWFLLLQNIRNKRIPEVGLVRYSAPITTMQVWVLFTLSMLKTRRWFISHIFLKSCFHCGRPFLIQRASRSEQKKLNTPKEWVRVFFEPFGA